MTYLNCIKNDMRVRKTKQKKKSVAGIRTADPNMVSRPLKQQLTLRIDSDVITWFKDHAPKGGGYQTEINRALREHVRRRIRAAGDIKPSG